MKAIRTAAIAALAAAGLAMGTGAQAATHGGSMGGHSMSGHGSWSGGSHWHGGGSWHGGGYWHGGHGHGYYPYSVGFYFGAPWVWGPWYWWGYPYDYYSAPYGYGYPPAGPQDGGAPYGEGTMQAPSTEVDPNAPGAPTQAPTYMNYCVSAKAYFPKVATCPEGWKFVPSH